MRVTQTLFACAVCVLAHVGYRVCRSALAVQTQLADLHPIKTSINSVCNLSVLFNFQIPYQTAFRPFDNTNMRNGMS